MYVHEFVVDIRLCRGKALYNAIHVQKEKYNINRAAMIASQIAQVRVCRRYVYY